MTIRRTQSCSTLRLQVLRFLLAGVLVAGLAYAFALQVCYCRKFREYAERIHTESIIPLAGRGRILDAKGRYLALTRTSFKVSADPRQLRKEGKCEKGARMFAQLLGCDSGNMARTFSERPAMFFFYQNIGYETGDSLRRVARKTGLDNCITVEPQMDRFYPYDDTLGSLLGFAVHDSGRAGLEAVLDPVLVGLPGRIVVQKDGLGNRYRFPAYPDVQPVNGADVRLTIDLDIQRIAYEELAACVDSFKADGGSAIVLECSTCAVLAMCDYPFHDPRNTSPDEATFRCRAAEESFEPGSVFKPVMGLAALESDNADRIRNTRFDVSAGVIEICGKKIHDVHPAGVQDFAGIFIHSSNVGLSMLSMMVDRDRYYQTMRKLGIGKRSGIELPLEDSGYVDPQYRSAPSRMSPVRVANNAFGQGLRTTLLQLADCYAAIANRGVLRRPFLVREIVCGDNVYRTEPLAVRQAVSPEAANAMKEILARVVTEGTGTTAASPYFTSAGKTGTAEKPPYSLKQIIATYVGFAPKDSPKYLVAVSVDNPRVGKYAGTIVGPTFRRICERCFLTTETGAPVALGGANGEGQ